ncbi:phosphoglycerate kinase [Facklamia miroungae]|uniref:Phosphoglycerate kinase n=1 Tax=Facklamia miroungae TaxID=120956 RepID=A0A1G7UHK7_9LACT|nr:phosphoglycerate kinase [Facklamia miroungae]NKZ30107.1 phosphoglycerate kinase [Facklamia miroungae]SDG46818.1 phosphoglycerate kinase [Facklamia miroungae]
MAKKTVRDLNVENKTVLVRVDFNVPMDGDKITDDNRIVAALDTIKYLIDHQAKVVLFSHLGKIKSAEDLDKADRNLKPVADRLSELLGQMVIFVEETRGEKLESAVKDLQKGQVLLVQNTRFEDVKGKKESGNDPELGRYWASLGDLFVNDAFGTAHRAHASNVGIASHLESAVGFLMEKEVKFLGEAVDQPQRPFVAILGGAKVSDKIKVIENLLDRADKILIGGGMAYTFFKAKGFEIGQSICEPDRVELAKEIMTKAGGKLVLPIDNVVAKKFANDAETKVVTSEDIPADYMGMDIGPETVELFKETLAGAKTVVWNGPMGVFEMENFSKGTIGVCEAIAQLEDATTIVGGGDSAAAVSQLGYEDKFTHISTGGGASLTYLEGAVLPGVDSINDK